LVSTELFIKKIKCYKRYWSWKVAMNSFSLQQ
jgi:hypothetical protein